MTKQEYRTAAVAAYREHMAVLMADDRDGFSVVMMTEQQGLGRRVATGVAIRKAAAAAKAKYGYIPRWVDLDQHTRVNLEVLREFQGCYCKRENPRRRAVRLGRCRRGMKGLKRTSGGWPDSRSASTLRDCHD